MINTTEQYINHFIQALNLSYANIQLVSGGSAWSDHLAVGGFLDYPEMKLVLHLPCKWTGIQFLDSGSYDWRLNPGRSINNYHHTFSDKVEINSLGEIQQAISKGAIIHDEYKGFHDRNLAVGKLISCLPLLSYIWFAG